MIQKGVFMRAQKNVHRITTRWLSCLLLFLAWTTYGAQAFAQGLPSELQSAWQKTGLPESALSLVGKEIDGPDLISINANTTRNTASVMKLVTTANALIALGPARRWPTQVSSAR